MARQWQNDGCDQNHNHTPAEAQSPYQLPYDPAPQRSAWGLVLCRLPLSQSLLVTMLPFLLRNAFTIPMGARRSPGCSVVKAALGLLMRIVCARIVVAATPFFYQTKQGRLGNDADPLRSIYLLPQSHQYSLRLTNGRIHHESIINSIKTSATMHRRSSLKKKAIHPLDAAAAGSDINRPPLSLVQ